ncbi:hypothetical protein AWB85_25350 [Mycobacteroides immunogenum]|uniref:HTH tetR-type domain-containing protein n=1 Tax=Mycobacteroides immunogenum TaxID=83262 RepID=A0A179VBJ8_9MYCO|nr:hypothetical protein AWB85_25350 [Mycobacteroides immunogenum]
MLSVPLAGGVVPPLNHSRRAHLADAAIRVLATYGGRGFTHRAVDSEAGEPIGTTSRYFRTRDSLFSAVAQRVREIHFSDLESDAPLPVIEDMALAQNRLRHLAMAELFLEGTRNPDLRRELTAIRRAQIDLVEKRFPDLSRIEIENLVCVITGRVFIGLTTPEAFIVEPNRMESIESQGKS